MRVLFFICSLLLPTLVVAQDSLVNQPKPRLFVFLDYGKIATMPSNFETKAEGGIGFRIAPRLALVAQVGYGSLTPNNAIENGSYNAKGTYFRFGFDRHFTVNSESSLSVGARYGLSNYTEELTYTVLSDLFEDITEDVTRSDVGAQWAELTFGSEMHLGEGPFYAGGYFSLRILISRDEFDPADTYTIPGYGRTFDKTIPAVQLYLKLAIF